MSKFHVGDEVTLHFTEEQLEQFALESEVNLDLSGEWTVERVYDSGSAVTYYKYEGQLYGVSNGTQYWDVPEEVLRPADIVALPVVDEPDWTAIQEAVDVVNHPPHYNRFPVEVINITEQLDFNRGNAVKYLTRAGFKQGVDELEDLSKAAWYVNRAIEKLKKERDDA